MKKAAFVIVLLLLVITTFYQLVRPGFYPMQDDLQAFRVHQMVKCLKDFQIPCRWVPDMGYQYGYPQFNYYSPLPYYIGAILNLLGLQIIDSVKILFILGFILSALTMYLFLRTFLNNWAALLGASLYTFIPVKATQVFVRGSLSEFWAFIFLPLLFWSSYQLVKLKKLKYLIWFSLSLALLLLTHNLTFLIFFPILFVWILTLMFLEKEWRSGIKIGLGLILGLGLASFYLLPVLFERQFVHLDSLVGGYFDYRQHFVSYAQLLFSNYFNYGSSVFGLGDEVSLSSGIVHWIGAAVAVILAIFNFKKDRKFSIIVLILGGLEMLVLFLMHQRSSFIWERIPVLAYLQFPWRFLVPSAFLLSVLSGCLVFLIHRFNKNLSKVLIILMVVSVILLHGNFFKPNGWLNISDQDKFSGQSWEKQLTISIFDYLPIYAKFPPNKRAPEVPEVLEGEVEILSYKKGSNYQIGELDAKENSIIRLPLFDFPGMKVEVDGRVVDHINNDCRGEDYCFGLITLPIPSGKHLIKAKLYDTPIRTFGNLITLISFFILVFLIFKIYGFKKSS